MNYMINSRLSFALILASRSLSVEGASENLGYGFSALGCACTEICTRTVDSPLKPWCYTSAYPYVAPLPSPSSSPSMSPSPSASVNATSQSITNSNSSVVVPTPTSISTGKSNNVCGIGFSSTRQAFWDWCSVNTTGVTAVATVKLSTFTDMWLVMTAASTLTVSAVYLLAGCIAAALAAGWPPKLSGTSLFVWLLFPSVASLFGSCHAFLVGSVLSALISLLYLSVPSAIDARVGIAMGISIAAFLIFGAFGRHARTIESTKTIHASETE
jgi:hypothetical protein